MPRGRPKKKQNDTAANIGFEPKLWLAADKLRGNMDAAEYKHVVLGLIFLKYISDAFTEMHATLEADKARGSDPEDPDEYLANGVFWVPPSARWSHLQGRAKDPKIGVYLDKAMESIELDNPSLKGVLPKNYAREQINKATLGQLIDLVGTIGLGDRESRSKDVLGRVYEYFLAQFASAEGKKGGQFYTPRCIVRLLVEMLRPFKGRVLDPCCGSGGMFVQSEEFVENHNGRLDDISVYGQESNQTTWRLCKMNLAIRHIESKMIAWNNEGSFHNDAHKDLKADFVLANPPFNDSDWGGDRLAEDKRWKYGKPPQGNANFAWVQHFIHHLAPTGMAGFVLANGSMSSQQSGEGDIRKSIVEANLVDCMIALPGQLFYSTQIPVCLWFICRDKTGRPSPNPLPKGEGKYRGGYEFAGLVEKARELRKKQTPAEEVLWEMLRDRGFMGLKFRRQHQVGDYIADFYCDEKKLVVELDGPVHDSDKQKKHDAKRAAYLSSLGIAVVRIKNDLVLNDPQAALARIVASLPVGETGVRVNGLRGRRGEVLFIDARKLGSMVDRTHRELTNSDIRRIADTYHAWKHNPANPHPGPLPLGEGDRRSGEGRVALGEGKGEGAYEDVPGFCKSASLDEVRGHNHILTPGRYVGAEEVEDDGEPFPEKMARLTKHLDEQFKESARLEKEIRKNLKGLGYGA